MNRKFNILIALIITILFLAGMTTHAAKKENDKLSKPKVTAVKSEKTKTASQTAIIESKEVPQSQQQTQQNPEPPSLKEPAEGEQVNWKVLASGGGTRTIGSFILGSTIGQTAVGWSTIGTNKLHSGFWQDFSAGQCCENRGNVDGIIGPFDPIDVADVTYLVAFLWQGGPDPLCIEEGNADGLEGPFGPIDVADLTYLVAFLWQGGSHPPPCP